MNKEGLLNLLKELELPEGEYYILGGGSLVMFGIKELTGDLDLCVSEELFEKLRQKYNLLEENKNACGFYNISNAIEVVPNKKDNFNYEIIDGYSVENLEQILTFKKKRSVPKDISDIEKIEKYLDKREN